MPDTLSPEQSAARVDKVVGGLEEANAAKEQPTTPEVDVEIHEPTTGELTEQYEMPSVTSEERNAPRPDAATNPVSNENILDLRDRKRAEATANAQSRLETLRAMEAADEPVVTAEALDRQAARDAGTNAEAPQEVPAAKKQSWFKRLLGQS